MTNTRLSGSGKNYRRLTYTYLIVMTFPLVVGIIMTFILNHETEKVIVGNYEDRLSYSADTVDGILKNTGSIAYKIVSDPNVVSYGNLEKPLEDMEDEYLKKPIQTSIVSEANINENVISDIIISFPQTQVMLSTQRTYRNTDRNLLCENSLGLTYEEVEELAAGFKGRQFFISPGRSNDGSPVAFLVQKGLGGSSKSLYVIIVLKYGSLTDALAYFNGTALIGESGSNYLTAKNTNLDPTFLESLFSEDITAQIHTINCSGYVAFAKKSAVSRWNYYLILEKNEYQNRISSYRNILIFVFAATIVLGVLLIRQISKIVYSPVKRLIGETGEEYSPKSEEDEFNFLSSVFRKLKESASENSISDLDENSLLSLTISRILCLGIWPNEQMAEKLRLRGSGFLLSILDVEFFSENLIIKEESEDKRLFLRSLEEDLCAASSDRSFFYFSRMNDEEKKRVSSATYNILAEMLSADDLLMSVVEGNIVLLLLLADDPEIREKQAAEFDRKIRKCFDILRNQVGIAVSAIIGNPTEKREQLCSQYEKLKLYLKKKHFLGTSENRVIYLCDEQPAEAKDDKSYEIEKSIGNKIVEKEYDVAYQMLEYFFNYILENNADYSLQFLQLRMYGMIYVLISSLGLNPSKQTDSNTGGEDPSFLSPDFLLMSESILELRNNVRLLFRELLRLHQDEDKSSVLARSDEICDYVNKHVFSPDICSAAICDEFHISASYLSRIFKQATGKNLLKYIHEARIARAKELLTKTDININDIANLVGFSDRRTFDRVFTGAEQMTPFNYRCSHQG